MNRVLTIALAEEGYLEKASNSMLYDKTANAGEANYTKYALEYKNFAGENYQGQPWCDMFVDWCFVKAYGVEKARKLLGGFSAYTPDSATFFKKMGRWYTSPKPGDVVFFKNSTRICHTGIVYAVDNNYVYTVEGNTSNGEEVIPNGGAVCKKKYVLSNSRIAGYGRPDYSLVSSGSSETSSGSSAPSTGSGANNVAKGQAWLNLYYGDKIKKYTGKNLTVDGKCGTHTRAAALCVWKDLVNRKHGFTLNPSNSNFYDSCLAAASKVNVRSGDSGTFVLIVQLILSAKGYYSGEMDADFGSGTENAVESFQKKTGLAVDGVVGKNTWYRLFN